MQINTRIPTLKRAWDILEEAGLEALLGGGVFKLDLLNMCNVLLGQGRLVEFLQVITGQPENPFDIELSEALGVAKSFFGQARAVLAESGLLVTLPGQASSPTPNTPTPTGE
ncbi:MAG: hypothetical protein K8R90_05145 [Candidatus Cloacimonetes bacterium]|nr:hypothetical protein [Candidatus Cloacimonadota bacterium]